MNFSQALESAKLGQKIYREDWNGNYFVFLMQGGIIEDHDSLPDLQTNYAPYLAVSTPCVYPWLPNHGDLFADDWKILIASN